jgi:hypothetical protein
MSDARVTLSTGAALALAEIVQEGLIREAVEDLGSVEVLLPSGRSVRVSDDDLDGAA